MKSILLQNWNIIRIIRLLMGIGIMYQGFSVGDKSIGFLGLIFTLLPLFNQGCCGVGGCETPINKNNQKNTQELIYEEVK